jgi:hypothetical protein
VALNRSDRRRAAASLLRAAVVSLAVAAAALIPLTPWLADPLLPASHEHTKYLVVFEHFREAFLSGVSYPRWLPDLNGGYGYPTFVFYQPGYFFAGLPVAALHLDPMRQMFVTLGLLSLVGAVGAYLLARQFCDTLTALFCTAFFMLTPYLFLNIYVRGDLSEFMSMTLTPWPLYFLMRLARINPSHSSPSSHSSTSPDPIRTTGARAFSSRSRAIDSLGLAVSLAMIVVSHPVTAMFFVPGVLLFALAQGANLSARERRTFWGEAAWSVGVGLLLSAPYWFTVLVMSGYVNLEAAFAGDYARHTVEPAQFFWRWWRSGLSFADTPHDGMSLQLGAPHFAFALAGAALAWRTPLLRLALACYLGLLVLMTPLSAPLWTWPVLRHAQFPWRLLAVTAVLQLLCATGLGRLYASTPFKKAGALTILLVLTLRWYGPMFEYDTPSDEDHAYYSWATLARDRALTTRSVFTYTATGGAAVNEFAPKTALRQPLRVPRGDAPLLCVSSPAYAEPLPDHTAFSIAYRVRAQAPAVALVNQLYLPGWKVLVDGVRVPRGDIERDLTPDGRIQVQVPAGVHEVRASYDGPPGWQVRNLLIAVGVLAYLAHLFVRRRARTPLPPPV